LVFSFLSCLYNLNLNPGRWIAGKDYLHSAGCFLTTVCFDVQRFLIWYNPTCQFLLLFHDPLESYAGNHWYVYILKCPHHVFCFKLLDLTIGSSINFDLIFVKSKREGTSFSLLHVDTQFSQCHLLKKLSFLQCTFLASLLKIWQLQLYRFIYISSVYSTELCVWFCSSTMLFSYLWLSSIIWSQVLW
jgi:hypothetical protein